MDSPAIVQKCRSVSSFVGFEIDIARAGVYNKAAKNEKLDIAIALGEF